MLKMTMMAPISKTDRAKLLHDAVDLQVAAKRKGVTLNRHEEAKEKMVASTHFELGCWLNRFTKLAGLPPEQYLSERIDIVTRLFLAGFNNPCYDFFTVFDFGERQFDGIFEQGDAELVLEGLRRNIQLDTTGKLVSAFKHFGWPLTAGPVESLERLDTESRPRGQERKMRETLNSFTKIVRNLDPQKRENLAGEIAVVTRALNANAGGLPDSSLQERHSRALRLAFESGGYDGAHHKMWVIDQMCRELLGSGYADWVASREAGEDGANTYSWDAGTPL